MIILDTNVLSELMKPKPAAPVVAWIGEQTTAGLYTTAITQAEILHGLMLVPAGRRRRALGSDAAPPYAKIATDRRRAGRPISQFDAQIAAIAWATGATVATRNVDDFEGCGVKVVNPWQP